MGYNFAVFVLGVGAQKAGTTSLFDQLEKNRAFKTLGGKELHYWDSAVSLKQQNIRNEAGVQAFFQNKTAPSGFASETHHEYFQRIERREHSGFRRVLGRPSLLADITPAYSGLPRFVFNEIANQLERRKIDYRVVYLLRDPVDRMSSAVNMNLHRIKKGEQKSEGVSWDRDIDKIFLEYASSWSCQFRTRYELTLDNLYASFPSELVFVRFLEDLGGSKQNESLAKFLDIPARSLRSDEQSRRGKYLVSPSPEARMQMAQFYEGTYRGVRDRFPHVETIWPGYRLLP